MKNVIVIGAGAAGMMAALMAARSGHKVLLLEKNEKAGKKIFITGKGRCNVTNACDVSELFTNVVTNDKFLYSAFYGFDNNQMMQLLEEAGCPLKIERGDRVFPVSDHSSDVIGAMVRLLNREKVEIKYHAEVKELLIVNKKAAGVVLKNESRLTADAVILATGGNSYSTTGSTGDGYRFARACGHTVTDIRPSLVPFETRETWCKDLMGLALKNVEVTLCHEKREIYKGFGEMLFTHFGVSGPLILSASSYYVKKCYGKQVLLTIDLKPALSEDKLDKRILRDFEENKNKQFKTVAAGLFPARLTPVVLQLSGIDPDKPVNEVTKEERLIFVRLIKSLPLTITGTRDFREAIITQGGVSVKEVNPSTMESKLLPGLYFAGELLDLDALTGGFNLQIAWSTGWLAGSSIE